MANNTVKLHLVIQAPPSRVYRAFTDADAMAKWLPPHGFTGKVQSMDARVGGKYHMSFTNFTTGQSHGFGGEYLELIPDKRLRYSDRFDDPNMQGEMITTVELNAVSSGTEIHIEQTGIPDAIPVDGCYVGWQQSIELLAKLVEPEIPNM